MWPPRNNFRLRALPAAGMASLLALSAFAGCSAPSQRSLLTAPFSRQGGTLKTASPTISSVAPIAAQIDDAAYVIPHEREYLVTNLGTFSGASYATAINNQGKVVGACRTPRGDVAFLWTRGHMRRLGSFSAYDINNRG